LVRCLQVVTVAVVAAGVLDIVFQRYVVLDLAATLAANGRDLDASEPGLNRIVLGFASLRAASTFDHPILFGTFCAAVIPIHLLTPMSVMRRVGLVAVCVTGCLIALSSAPLLATFMAFSVCLYDALFRRNTWRWRLLLSALAIGITAFSMASENPMSWIFRNLTLDPQTAYFRLMIWDAGMEVVANNPWLGNGFNPTGVRILDASTDSLWLAKTIVYGIPMTTLLYLAPIAAMMPTRHDAAIRSREPRLGVMCTAFSMALTVMMFVSITVTFWNATWLFFALCIGVRTSLKERCLLARG
jgi:O-antigen ligase